MPLSEDGLTLEKARAVASSEPSEAAVQDIGLINASLVGGRVKGYLELVNNVSGQRLEIWPLRPHAPVPRTGEEIVLRDSNDLSRSFRVIDVSYEFNAYPDGGRLETVRLRLEPLPNRSSSKLKAPPWQCSLG
jgi:hypothetical protein